MHEPLLVWFFRAPPRPLLWKAAPAPFRSRPGRRIRSFFLVIFVGLPLRSRSRAVFQYVCMYVLLVSMFS
jgi:hypothetical protein